MYQQIIVSGVIARFFSISQSSSQVQYLISNLIDFNPTFGEEKSSLGLSETDYEGNKKSTF